MTTTDDGSWTLHRIAVATDLSHGSELSVERAAGLARQHGARLTLLHVVPIGVWDDVVQRLADAVGSTPPTQEALQQGAREVLLDLARDTAARHRVECDARVSIGRPGREVATLAGEIGADLLVLGAHGQHPVRDLLLGTTVQKVMRLSPCPVLVVKRAPSRPYRVVLLPTDLSDASRRAVAAAVPMFPQARLHPAHAFELPYDGLVRRYAFVGADTLEEHHEAARERLLVDLGAWCDSAGVPRERRTLHVEHGYPATRIQKWIRSLRADLVVVAAYGRSPMETTFIGSVSLHTALTARCDVLLPRGGGFA